MIKVTIVNRISKVSWACSLFSDYVLAGVTNLRERGAVERRIIKTVEHPDFKPPHVYFDVSLAVLDKVCNNTYFNS